MIVEQFYKSIISHLVYNFKDINGNRTLNRTFDTSGISKLNKNLTKIVIEPDYTCKLSFLGGVVGKCYEFWVRQCL